MVRRVFLAYFTRADLLFHSYARLWIVHSRLGKPPVRMARLRYDPRARKEGLFPRCLPRGRLDVQTDCGSAERAVGAWNTYVWRLAHRPHLPAHRPRGDWQRHRSLHAVYPRAAFTDQVTLDLSGCAQDVRR